MSIEAGRAADPRRLKSRHKLAHVVRPNFQPCGRIGRYEEDTIPVSRPFEGRIEDGNRDWSVIGVEALGLDSLRRLRTESDWPRDAQWCDGRCGLVSRKALAHAAITVLRPGDSPSDRCGVRLRWAVFFPLDDGPGPNTVVEPVGCVHESDVWDIILHGYFWPSQDRGSIPGVTDDDAGIGDGDMRVRWNKAVCDKLLTFGGEDAVGTVRNLFGNVARFDFGEVADQIPKVDLPDMVPFFKALFAVLGKRPSQVDEVRLNFKTPQQWMDDFTIAERYDLLFTREHRPGEGEDIAGIGLRVVDRAIQPALKLPEALAAVGELAGPLVIFALRDRITGSEGAVRTVIVVLQQREGGVWELLRDWEMIKPHEA